MRRLLLVNINSVGIDQRATLHRSRVIKSGLKTPVVSVEFPYGWKPEKGSR